VPRVVVDWRSLENMNSYLHGEIEFSLILTPPSLHRVTLGDLWSVRVPCRELCPGVMSLVTPPPSLVSTPKSATTWSGSGRP
jgi:hypothetical protein